MIIVMMGVAGSGKTTIGRQLAAALGYGFSDGDELHDAPSVEKMRSGVALNDADREPWLRAVGAAINEKKRAGKNHVFACSALKARYRELLGAGDPEVRFVYLKGDGSLIRQRLNRRAGHFFNPVLIASQLEALEEPRDALPVNIAQAPAEIVGQIIAGLALEGR